MITTVAEACWVLRKRGGIRQLFRRVVDIEHPYSDGSPHFESDAAADRGIEYLLRTTFWREGRRAAPVRLRQPCVVARCDECGYTYDEDGEGLEHHEDPDTLADSLRGAGWRGWPVGNVFCPGCVEDGKGSVTPAR